MLYLDLHPQTKEWMILKTTQSRGHICMGNYKNVNNINGQETFIND